jgi:hypothetical protein
VLDALNFHQATIPLQKLDNRFGSVSQYWLADQPTSSAITDNIGYLSSEFPFPVYMTNHGIGAREQVEGKERLIVLSSMCRCTMYETRS